MFIRPLVDWIAWGIVLVVALSCGVLLASCEPAHASIIPDEIEFIDQERLADAIYKAENSVKYPYGIKSVDTHVDKAYARKICLNTINNNLARWQWARQQGDARDFITFLGARFCPIGASDDPMGLNGNWVRNVTRLYHRELASRGL